MGYSEKELRYKVKEIPIHNQRAWVDYSQKTIQLPALIMTVGDLSTVLREAMNWIYAKALSEAPQKLYTKEGHEYE